MAARPVANTPLGRGGAAVPAQPYEVTGRLKQTHQAALNSAGNTTLGFITDNAWQRWEVTQVVVSTNQPVTNTPIPSVTVYVNATTSMGNAEGSTTSGNQDTLAGLIDLSPVDTLNVAFTGGVPGALATATVTGTKFTRRR